MADLEEEKYVSCSNCKKDIAEQQLRMHEIYCKKNIKKCEQCEDYVDKNDIQKHIEEVHTKVPCKYCNKQFEQKDLDKHLNSCNQKPKMCEFCSISYPASQYFDHNYQCGSRTKQCEVCQKNIIVRDYEFHNSNCTDIPQPIKQTKNKENQKVVDPFDQQFGYDNFDNNDSYPEYNDPDVLKYQQQSDYYQDYFNQNQAKQNKEQQNKNQEKEKASKTNVKSSTQQQQISKNINDANINKQITKITEKTTIKTNNNVIIANNIQNKPTVPSKVSNVGVKKPTQKADPDFINQYSNKNQDINQNNNKFEQPKPKKDLQQQQIQKPQIQQPVIQKNDFFDIPPNAMSESFYQSNDPELQKALFDSIQQKANQKSQQKTSNSAVNKKPEIKQNPDSNANQKQNLPQNILGEFDDDEEFQRVIWESQLKK